MDEQDPGTQFLRIHRKALSMGLTDEDLNDIESIDNLRVPKKSTFGLVLGIVCLCLATVLGVLLAEWPVSRTRILDIWFNHYDMELEKEVCLVELREGVLDFLRPPVDCGFCRGIKAPHRVTKVHPEEFESTYAYSGQPVVIEDAMQNWTAPKIFNFTYFKSIYSKDSPALTNEDTNCQFFPYRTNFERLEDVFDMDDNRAMLVNGSEPWYIGWSNCDPVAANEIRKHYTRPYFLPKVAESSKTDWIFMGSPGYGAHMHIDNVGNPSWQAQVTGQKKWQLEPPPECYRECTTRMEVVVKPGEIIVLDTNKWFHSTLILGKEMSITIGSEYD